MLDDFVLSALCASAGYGTIAVAFERERVLADGFPPDVCDCASSSAVNALNLVSADDDVGEGTAVCNDEDGVALATLARRAGYTTTEFHHTTVEVGNFHGLR